MSVIDKPGEYETADGSRVKIVAVVDGWAMGSKYGAPTPHVWRADGKWDTQHNGRDHQDITGPWPPAQEPRRECWVDHDGSHHLGPAVLWAWRSEKAAKSNASHARHMVEIRAGEVVVSEDVLIKLGRMEWDNAYKALDPKYHWRRP